MASIEYRLSGEAVFPAQIQDCKAAIRWLRANGAAYGLDPARIAAWGSSAGGHLVALLGTSSEVAELPDLDQGNACEADPVQAVVDWYGPTDFLQMPGTTTTPTRRVPRLLGCDIDECPDRVAFASPLSYVDPGDPPFLIQHGSRDATVDPNQSVCSTRPSSRPPSRPRTWSWPGAGHGGPEFTDPGEPGPGGGLPRHPPPDRPLTAPMLPASAASRPHTAAPERGRRRLAWSVAVPLAVERPSHSFPPRPAWLRARGTTSRSSRP